MVVWAKASAKESNGEGPVFKSLVVMISPTPAAAKGDLTRGTLLLTFGAALDGRLGDCCEGVVIVEDFVIVPGIARSKFLELVGDVVCIGIAMQLTERLSENPFLPLLQGPKSATPEIRFPPLFGAGQMIKSSAS